MLSEHHGASGIARDPTAPNAVPVQKSQKLADSRISHNSEETEKQAVREGRGESAAKGKIPYRFKINHLPVH